MRGGGGTHWTNPDFKYSLLCFGKHKGPCTKKTNSDFGHSMFCIGKAQRSMSNSGKLTLPILPTLIWKAQRPWTNQTKSDFEYCILCFGKHKGPEQIRLNQTSTTAYSALGSAKAFWQIRLNQTSSIAYSALESTKVNQTKSDFEYCLLCFGKHKGP